MLDFIKNIRSNPWQTLKNAAKDTPSKLWQTLKEAAKNKCPKLWQTLKKAAKNTPSKLWKVLKGAAHLPWLRIAIIALGVAVLWLLWTDLFQADLSFLPPSFALDKSVVMIDRRYIAAALGSALAFLVVVYGAVVRTGQLGQTIKQNKHEAYARALEQAGHPDSAIQKAGLLSLLSYAKKHPKEQDSVMEAVCVMIVDRSHQAYEVHQQAQEGKEEKTRFVTDSNSFVQTALNLFFQNTKLFIGSPKNLNQAHLEGVNLYSAYLEGANLNQAHLEDAYLWHAHLEDAHLWLAHLERAKLTGAHLEGANLGSAQGLERARYQLAFGLDKAEYVPVDIWKNWSRGECRDARESLQEAIEKDDQEAVHKAYKEAEHLATYPGQE